MAIFAHNWIFPPNFRTFLPNFCTLCPHVLAFGPDGASFCPQFLAVTRPFRRYERTRHAPQHSQNALPPPTQPWLNFFLFNFSSFPYPVPIFLEQAAQGMYQSFRTKIQSVIWQHRLVDSRSHELQQLFNNVQVSESDSWISARWSAFICTRQNPCPKDSAKVCSLYTNS